jgi:hypothetical protein
LRKVFIYVLAIAFLNIMHDKMSAETSNWAKDSNKHYTISKISSIKNFNEKVFICSTVLLNEETFLKVNHFQNIQYPSTRTTKLYILFCELKFA